MKLSGSFLPSIYNIYGHLLIVVKDDIQLHVLTMRISRSALKTPLLRRQTQGADLLTMAFDVRVSVSEQLFEQFRLCFSVVVYVMKTLWTSFDVVYIKAAWILPSLFLAFAMDGPCQEVTYESAYEEFCLWTVTNLKAYLAKRGWSTTGTKEVLISKAVCAWSRRDGVIPTVSEEHSSNIKEYQALLVSPSCILPDPRSLKTGWTGEQNRMSLWPPIYITDMSDLFDENPPRGKELC